MYYFFLVLLLLFFFLLSKNNEMVFMAIMSRVVALWKCSKKILIKFHVLSVKYIYIGIYNWNVFFHGRRYWNYD